MSHKRFDRCHQGQRTVQDFVYELCKLAMFTGERNERPIIVRLWDGLHSNIRQYLYILRLNSETSTFEEDCQDCCTSDGGGRKSSFLRRRI